jgi:hypothetical protein
VLAKERNVRNWQGQQTDKKAHISNTFTCILPVGILRKKGDTNLLYTEKEGRYKGFPGSRRFILVVSYPKFNVAR